MASHPRFDLIILDCDGVLVDSETISCRTLVDILSPLDPDYDLEAVMRRYLGRPASAVVEDYERMTGRPAPESFRQDWRARLFSAFSAALQPIAGVREAVEGFDVDYCVASSSDEERIEHCLRKVGLWDLFAGRIFSTTRVQRGKPAPDLFLHAAAALDTDPAACAVVEDSVYGVQAGVAAGMTVYGFGGGLTAVETLAGAGAITFEAMLDLRDVIAPAVHDQRLR